MDKQEAIDQIREAQEMLLSAVEILRRVAMDLQDRHAEAYLVAQLACLASSDSGYLSADFNCDQWIEQLAGEEGGDE